MADLRTADRAINVYASSGATIFLQGDSADYWYQIETGTVMISHLYSDGHRHVLAFLFPGDVLGVETGVYRTSAEAITCVVLRRHSRSPSSIETGRSAENELAYARALEIADDNLHVLGRKTAIERVAAFLVRISRRQGGKDEIRLSMTRGDIADHLGITLETASRSLCDLARRGILSFKSPRIISIRDFAALQRLGGIEDPAPAQMYAKAG